jgi:hypothetical protein
MPIPEDLRLSTDPDYIKLWQSGDYAGAARYAMWLYNNVFGIDPSVDDSKATTPRHERARFFDAPTNEEGIKRHAEREKTRRMFGAGKWGRVAHKGLEAASIALGAVPGYLARQNVAEALPVAAKNFFAGWGLGERDPGRHDAPLTTKGLQVGAEIGMNLLPYVGMTKALAAPKLAGLGTRKLGAKLFGAGTKGAHTIQASGTLGAAGGLTETGRQMAIHISNELGGTTQEAQWEEIPMATASFAAGGVPVSRLLAIPLQAAASTVSQAAFKKGQIDPQRVIMEAAFAGLFGNPQFRDMRNRAVRMTPDIARKIEEAHNTKHPRSRVQQLYKEGEVATAEYVEVLSKQPLEALEKMAQAAKQANDDYSLRVARDAIAEKQGDIVVGGPEAPSGPGTRTPGDPSSVPTKPTPQKRPMRKLTNKDKVATAMFENPEGLTIFQIMEITGLKKSSAWRALRDWDNPKSEGSPGRGTGKVQRLGPGDGLYERYALSKAAQKEYVPPNVDMQKPQADEIGKQIDEAGRTADDTTLPTSVREAAQQQQIRLSQMLENMTDVDATKLTVDQAEGYIKEVLEGRTKGEIDSWLADASKLPDELKSFRQAVVRVAGNIFRRFPEDTLMKARADALAPHVTKDTKRSIYKEDIPRDIDSLRSIAAQWDIEIRPEGEGWSVYRKGKKRIGKEGPESEKDMYDFVNTMARGRATKDRRYSIESIHAAAKTKGWGKQNVGNGKIKLIDPRDGTEHVLLYDDAVDFINRQSEHYDVSADRLSRDSDSGPESEAKEQGRVEQEAATTEGKFGRYEIEQAGARWKLIDNESGASRYFDSKDAAADYAEQLVSGKVTDTVLGKKVEPKPEEPTPTTIRWGKSSDGMVEDAAGRFFIEANFMGRTKPQNYTLHDGAKRYPSLSTQKEAKDLALKLLKTEPKPEPTTVKPTEEPTPDNQINQEPVASEEAPALSGQKVAGTNVTLMDEAATSRLLPHGFEGGTPPKKGEKIHATPSGWAKMIMPIPRLLHLYSDLTGIPIFRKVWDPTNTQINKRDAWMRPHEEALGKIHKNIPRYRQHAVHQSGPSNAPVVQGRFWYGQGRAT